MSQIFVVHPFQKVNVCSVDWQLPRNVLPPEGRTPNTPLPRVSSVLNCKLKGTAGCCPHLCRYVHPVVDIILIDTESIFAKVSRFRRTQFRRRNRTNNSKNLNVLIALLCTTVSSPVHESSFFCHETELKSPN